MEEGREGGRKLLWFMYSVTDMGGKKVGRVYLLYSTLLYSTLLYSTLLYSTLPSSTCSNSILNVCGRYGMYVCIYSGEGGLGLFICLFVYLFICIYFCFSNFRFLSCWLVYGGKTLVSSSHVLAHTPVDR